jgi:hypothetical protein
MLSQPGEQQQTSSALDRQGRQREDMYGQQMAAIAVNHNRGTRLLLMVKR